MGCVAVNAQSFEPLFHMGIENDLLPLKVLKVSTNVLKPLFQCPDILWWTETCHACRMALHPVTGEVFECLDLQIESFRQGTGESREFPSARSFETHPHMEVLESRKILCIRFMCTYEDTLPLFTENRLVQEESR